MSRDMTSDKQEKPMSTKERLQNYWAVYDVEKVCYCDAHCCCNAEEVNEGRGIIRDLAAALAETQKENERLNKGWHEANCLALDKGLQVQALTDCLNGSSKAVYTAAVYCQKDKGELMRCYDASSKRGCPMCSGIDAKSCCRCKGKTRMNDWYNTPTGWAHVSELTQAEIRGGIDEGH